MVLVVRSKFGLLNTDLDVSAVVLRVDVFIDLEEGIDVYAMVVDSWWALDVVGLVTMLDDVICVLLITSQILNQKGLRQ